MYKNFFAKPFTIDRIARLFFVILLVALGIFVLKSIWYTLLPLLLAWLVAYMIHPLVNFFQYKLRIKSRALSVFILLLLIAGVVTGIVLLLVPQVIVEVNKFWELAKYYATTENLLSIMPSWAREKIARYHDANALFAELNLERLLKGVQQGLLHAWTILKGTVAFLSNAMVVFLFLLYLIFILIDYDGMSKGFFSLIPDKAKPYVREAVYNITYYINNYFKGQSLIAFIAGVCLAIGFTIAGLPMGITMGLLVGVLNLVPYLQMAAYPPVLLLVLLQSLDTGQSFWILLIIYIAIFAVVQVFEDAFLTPKIMGKTMGMKPAVILLSLAIWGSLFGFLGLLFSLPLTMILYTYYMKYVVGKPLDLEDMQVEEKNSDPSNAISKREQKAAKE